jgi:hypothetical protein
LFSSPSESSKHLISYAFPNSFASNTSPLFISTIELKTSYSFDPMEISTLLIFKVKTESGTDKIEF